MAKIQVKYAGPDRRAHERRAKLNIHATNRRQGNDRRHSLPQAKLVDSRPQNGQL